MESGHISIHAENILPIIKRWLYSEKEIFARELVSNAADAILKLQKLALVGDVDRELPDAGITVRVDKDKGQVIISDTGLGMTADEIKRYINQVAFSGLHDFLDKYKDKDDGAQVIGHFGLGFYSSFMVASKVEIETLSFKAGATPAHWSCDGSTEFVLTEGTRTEIGTDIILHIADDSREMLDEGMMQTLIMRYCAFIRYPIRLDGAVINDPQPLWTKAPSSLTDQDYIDFFHKLFPGNPDPLFWIHLNVDHPFNLKGVLYFPKLKHELDASQGEVKLYCNQVYVADNTKELIPDWLMLLKGVIDCPDLPLNVSRSYLQSDPTVRKIAEHVTKKVADKLAGMAKADAEAFERYWDDIHPFVKYGMMRDHKFAERMRDHLIWKLASGGHVTLEQYAERMKDKGEEGVVLYVSDKNAQAAYLNLLQEQQIEAVIADTMIDQHFIPFFESELRATSKNFKFRRVDSDLSGHLVGEKIDIVGDSGKTSTETLEQLFKEHLDKKVKIRVEALKSPRMPAMLLVDEGQRRLHDMAKSGPMAAMMGAFGGAGGPEETLVVNQASPAVKGLLKIAGAFNRGEETKLMVDQIYDLACLQQGELTAEMLQGLIDRSSALLGRFGDAVT